MANENLEKLEALIQKLVTEVAVGEERLANKVEKTEFLEKTQKIKNELLSALADVDKKVTNLYIKVLALTSLMATGISIAVKFIL